MNHRISAVITALLLFCATLSVSAEERMLAGQLEKNELMEAGAVETITSPDRIVSEVSEDVRNFGVGGLATGAAAGGVKAVGQALRGAARFTIGFMDVFTAPIRESSYNRNSIGGLRSARPQR